MNKDNMYKGVRLVLNWNGYYKRMTSTYEH